MVFSEESSNSPPKKLIFNKTINDLNTKKFSATYESKNIKTMLISSNNFSNFPSKRKVDELQKSVSNDKSNVKILFSNVDLELEEFIKHASNSDDEI